MTPALRRRPQRRYPGLYRGVVTGTTDPQQASRVQVTFPWLPRSPATWAPTLREVGGPPEVGDEVLVGFDAGHLTRPYVVGVLASASPVAPPGVSPVVSPVVELADENGNSVRLGPTGIDITAAAEVHINASTIRLSSGAGVADAGTWTFSGVVKSQTLITEAVVASSYMPGAGNIS